MYAFIIFLSLLAGVIMQEDSNGKFTVRIYIVFTLKSVNTWDGREYKKSHWSFNSTQRCPCVMWGNYSGLTCQFSYA